ncbi:3-oxoacyl-[acyl-carrier protein] reductase [Nocardioides aromaticivorans]|uniref:3-oxoacyl-[acyl-carrier protein] reductase n=1 Tax=Nocardioides aromaticivorans TaxID=200618 RepID=A0A7Y9ZL03_9ACTN|nr:SDR family oxidoreductase [Nocardioides aromaticivorans]NYI47409.1 3-oxoacyl-[acyl-carrier protein] reductase [Nocardioides aromaticivorans]
MDLGVRDHVYLLTGATRGLGHATAEALVADGARVVVSGRRQESVDAAVAALEAVGGAGCAVGVVADNAAPDSADRLVAAAKDAWGRLDGVLVSVGGPPGGKVTDMTDEQWLAAFDSVFLGAVRLARTTAAALGEGGSIAFVLSTSVRQPIAGLAISNGLRPGLAMVAKNLADELGPRGIRVNGLLPGRIATERVAELDASTGDAEASKAAAVAQIPLGRYGRPEEFGRVAAFLLSPVASFLSGVMVPVDGGMSRGL